MKRIALYPGSFDPLTLGHVDIIQRAMPIFDKLYICVANSSNKEYAFSFAERKDMIEASIDQAKIEVVVNTGLTADLAKDLEAKYILRGIRTYMDMEYEKSMDTMNRHLYPELETIFLFASGHLSSISSSLVKEVAKLGGDISSFVPAAVLEAINDKVRKNAVK